MSDINTRAFRKKVKYYRAVMRGYSLLKKQQQLSLLDEIRNEITDLPILEKERTVWLLKEERNMGVDEDLVVRQYLIQRLLSLEFNKAVLFTLATQKPLSYPLPLKWHSVLRKKGVKVNSFMCVLLFLFKIVSLGAYGIAEMGNQFLRSLRPSVVKHYAELGTYTYFDSLQSSNLPDVSGDFKYGILSSYILKFPKPSNLSTICHSVLAKNGLIINGLKTRYIPSAIPPVGGFQALLKTFFTSLLYVFIALFDFLRFRWHSMLMLREKLKAVFFKNSDPVCKASQFLFNNSHWIYRPLWTYHASEGGAYVGLYFYSTNCERFKQAGNYPPIAFSWPITTWPVYLVWDEYQADFIRRSRKRDGLTKIIGNISFQFSSQPFEIPSQPYIAVFDVQPMRDTFHNIIGMDMAYYVPSVACKFIDDIISCAQEKGLVVVIKQKRNIGKNLHFEYRNIFKKYEGNKFCLIIDPDIEAERIIEESVGVISMPFTSTAILGQSLGKPSIYYDSACMLERDDRAAHGIQILQFREDLEKWLKLLIKSPLHV